jgi:hypothetical protein
MTEITSDQVQTLINEGCLTIDKVEAYDKSQFVSPSDIADGSWMEKAKTRVYASLCGVRMETRFNPNDIGAGSNILDKLVALQAGDYEPERRPTEEEVTHKALAEAITDRLPSLSNHAKLRIYDALGLTEEDDL